MFAAATAPAVMKVNRRDVAANKVRTPNAAYNLPTVSSRNDHASSDTTAVTMCMYVYEINASVWITQMMTNGFSTVSRVHISQILSISLRSIWLSCCKCSTISASSSWARASLPRSRRNSWNALSFFPLHVNLKNTLWDHTALHWIVIHECVNTSTHQNGLSGDKNKMIKVSSGGTNSIRANWKSSQCSMRSVSTITWPM